MMRTTRKIQTRRRTTTSSESRDGDSFPCTSSREAATHSSLAQPPSDDLDFAVLHASGRRAVNEQTLARTLHELEKVAPKLGQLAEWLKEAHLGQDSTLDIQSVEMVKTPLDNLTAQLSRMLNEVRADGYYVAPLRCETPPPRLGLDRALDSSPSLPDISEIIGPSPERKTQKRHQSWSVY